MPEHYRFCRLLTFGVDDFYTLGALPTRLHILWVGRISQDDITLPGVVGFLRSNSLRKRDSVFKH